MENDIMKIDMNEFMQTPEAIVRVDEGEQIGLILKDWDVEQDSAYSKEEVEQLINMLQESLNMMNKYIQANQNLPLFEKAVDNVQQQETPVQ